MMKTFRRKALALGLAALCAPVLSMAQSAAQATPATPAAAGWPAKPVTLVTPFPAGSGPDVVLRQVADRLGRNLGQRVIVENRPGGNGFIAIDAVQRAPADGYTFLQLDSEHLGALPHLFRQRAFKPFDALAPVATFYRTPFMVVVPAASPWKDMRDLVAAAKAADGKMNYGSWFVGSPGHLGGELLEQLSGVKMQHVPFREMGQLFAAVGNADIDWSFGSIPSSQGAYRMGKVRYLAVAANRRVPAMPDVPTVAEAGGPAGLEVGSFVVLMGPRGLPAPIVAKMNAEMARVAADPELRARYDTFAFEPITWSPDEIVRNAEAKSKIYADLIRRGNIQLD